MKDVSLHVTSDTDLSKDKLLKIFKAEVDDFSKWLEKAPSIMQQGALIEPERVLLLSYLMQKYAGNLDKE